MVLEGRPDLKINNYYNTVSGVFLVKGFDYEFTSNQIIIEMIFAQDLDKWTFSDEFTNGHDL